MSPLFSEEALKILLSTLIRVGGTIGLALEKYPTSTPKLASPPPSGAADRYGVALYQYVIDNGPAGGQVYSNSVGTAS